MNSSNVQYLEVDFDGKVISSKGNLYQWSQGARLQNTLPFFSILEALKQDKENEVVFFPAVHLSDTTNDKVRICDIDIVCAENLYNVYIKDHTERYEELTDISQQKNESQIALRTTQLRNELLQEKEKFKNQFISDINHELRAPLTSILGFTEILEKSAINFEQEELSRIIKGQALHLSQLVDDIIDISKIESGKTALKEEVFNFKEFIEEICITFDKTAEEIEETTFEYDIDNNIQEELIGDKTKIRQILSNILTNAFKFAPDGKVSFSIKKSYQRTNRINIQFEIKDNGEGIAQEDIPHIFDRFSRFSSSTALGTGLGLSIVKHLVELHKGKIEVFSEVGTGTTFQVIIPFKFDIQKKKSRRKVKKYKLPETPKKFRVLLVEDHDAVQYLVMKILIMHGRFFVDLARSGKQAISYLERKTYDLVLLDLRLEDMDGFQLTNTVRKNYGDKVISEVPIVSMSACPTNNQRDICLKAGMNDFIKKPFLQEDLINKIVKEISKKYA